MTDPSLLEAQAERRAILFSDEIDKILSVTFADSVISTEARENLGRVLKHYAQDPAPFRACVRDNIGRFGPGRTEDVCATLKDIIRGATSWKNDATEVYFSDSSDFVSKTMTQSERAEVIKNLTDADFAALTEVITNA